MMDTENEFSNAVTVTPLSPLLSAGPASGNYSLDLSHAGPNDVSDGLFSPSAQVLLTFVYVVGISGNVAALVMLKRHETQRNKRQLLMLKCLAWNDLLALTGTTIQMHLQVHLPSPLSTSPYFCGVRVFWRAFGLGSGCVALAMAVERWFAMTKPFVYQSKVTYQKILWSIFGLWIAVTILACLPFFGFGHFYDRHPSGWKRCSRGRYGTTAEDIAYAYIWFGFGLMMCLLIVGCNLGVIQSLHEMSRRSRSRRLTYNPSFGSQMNRESAHYRQPSVKGGHAVSHVGHTSVAKRESSVCRSSGHPSRHIQEEIKFARLMIILSIFYVICWIPQLVAIPMGLANPLVRDRLFFQVADVCIALNYVLDPFIYVILRGQCIGRCFLFSGCKYCCWPYRKAAGFESAVATELAKDDACARQPHLPNADLESVPIQDRDYVPLKVLLDGAADPVESSRNAEEAQDHPRE